ncbi:glycosyltransferase family 1 protein [Herbiconiux sp. L3-i23]|uniref:glycosyltransferase family 4 protein n=1 Tax=Herbiconiux sp. L3-i23 TaxID=2905871 RepID=UPI002061ED47|nr:glycosyltransferase family 1 protein [Herbiconiux sp. L3-i23]BDI21611.1 glycosyl transferase family 1 [Herbiconiux sp. L3-i23]
MVTLRVVVDPALTSSPRGTARYSVELTRALIANAPADCEVEGIASALDDAQRDALAERLPELEQVHHTSLGHRELALAWQSGFTTRPLGGMIHSPTLLAPLSRHDRHETPGEQTVVTIHDAAPWLFPDSNDPNQPWVRRMAKRARKHADAIVVPTHAVAEDLSRFIDFGDRIRVIGGAVSSSLTVPTAAEADAIAERLQLPDEYALTVGTLDPRRGIESLFRAAASPRFPDLPLLHVGPSTWREQSVERAIFESGAPEGRIRHLDPLPDAELAVVFSRATVVVVPSVLEGFGLTAVEALHFGRPLVHSDAPALLEVVAGAGVEVDRSDAGAAGVNDYAERLAEAIADTVGDTALLERLGIEARDRARAFSWRDSAERVWQLHADL